MHAPDQSYVVFSPNCNKRRLGDSRQLFNNVLYNLMTESLIFA